MSDTPDPNVQQQIDEAAKRAVVPPSSETHTTDPAPPPVQTIQSPVEPPPEPLLRKQDDTGQPEIPDQLHTMSEEIVIKAEPSTPPSVQKNENPQQNHHRPRVSPTVLLSLLLLIVTLPLAALYISQQKQLTEIRSRAAILLPKPIPLNVRSMPETSPIQNQSPVATPSAISATAQAYDKLVHTYFGQYVDDLSAVKARIWNVFVTDTFIHGTVYLKYDDTVDKTFIFSRLQGLVPVTKKVFHLWLVKDNRFSQAGVIDVTDEDGVLTGYSAFEQTGDLRDYEQLVISQDASVSAKPESVIATLDVNQEAN